jgi:hypothetical protein
LYSCRATKKKEKERGKRQRRSWNKAGGHHNDGSAVSLKKERHSVITSTTGK